MTMTTGAATKAADDDDKSYLEFLEFLQTKNVDDSVQSSSRSGIKNEQTNDYANAKPVPFLSLFRHGSSADIAIMIVGMVCQTGVGVSFAAMNLVFGQLIDSLASPSGSVLDATTGMIRIMAILAVAFALLAFVGMSATPYGAARITNRVRKEYIKSVLAQDMEFFDEAKPGGIVAALSSYTMDFEEGLSIKLGEGIQSCWYVVRLHCLRQTMHGVRPRRWGLRFHNLTPFAHSTYTVVWWLDFLWRCTFHGRLRSVYLF